jgi:hypothetical protein
MKFAATLLASALATGSVAADLANSTAVFDEVREAIDSSIIGNMAFSMGDSRGEIFRYEKGLTLMETRMGIASATKWVSGVAVMAVVETGALNLDDLSLPTIWITGPQILQTAAPGLPSATCYPSLPASLDPCRVVT